MRADMYAMTDASDRDARMMICYWSLEQDRLVVVEGSPFEPLLDWDGEGEAAPVDADVVFVFVTDSADELLKQTRYAFDLAEEDVVGLSALPSCGEVEVDAIVGLDDLHEVYEHRR